MKLYHSPASPFVRKVRVLALETGLHDRLDLHDVAMTPVAPSADLNHDNPLGKIPALVLDDGTTLYDSRVICEYLDTLHQGIRLHPPSGPERFGALRRQALADGMLDAAVNTRYETFLRPEAHRWPEWSDNQQQKFRRAADQFEGEPPERLEKLDIGNIALACALGYLDFRFPGERWRDTRPRLAAWYGASAERPSMLATAPE